MISSSCSTNISTPPSSAFMKPTGLSSIWSGCHLCDLDAPVPQPDHRERAFRAALLLQKGLLEFDVAQRGVSLRTRVGLHSGIVCVGTSAASGASITLPSGKTRISLHASKV